MKNCYLISLNKFQKKICDVLIQNASLFARFDSLTRFAALKQSVVISSSAGTMLELSFNIFPHLFSAGWYFLLLFATCIICNPAQIIQIINQSALSAFAIKYVQLINRNFRCLCLQDIPKATYVPLYCMFLNKNKFIFTKKSRRIYSD